MLNVDEIVRFSVLLDFYGAMLTPNQYEIARSYVDFNSSLAEIAEQTDTTRQAVGDVLHRTFKKLNEIESKLGFYAKYERMQEQLPVVLGKTNLTPEQRETLGAEFMQLIKELNE